MSGNFAIKGGGGVGRLMANAILNFHFDFLTPSLIKYKSGALVTQLHDASVSSRILVLCALSNI